MKLINFFIKNLSTHQKQYEAFRAIAFKEGSIKQIAIRFGYTPASLNTLMHRLLSGKHSLFPEIKTGPKSRSVQSETIKLIVDLRRNSALNGSEITEKLNKQNIKISVRTVERILKDAGFPKLRRRTDEERGISKEGTIVPERSGKLNLKNREPFRVDCQVAGVFFFLPYILESGILDIVKLMSDNWMLEKRFAVCLVTN